MFCPSCGASQSGSSTFCASCGARLIRSEPFPNAQPIGRAVGCKEAVTLAFKSYARGRGRATRAEYWWFYLFTLIGWAVVAPLVILAAFLQSESVMLIVNTLWSLWLIVYILAMFIPSITITVRRLHDTGKSAQYLWFLLLPFVGGMVIFILTLLPSDVGSNVYGPPRAAG